VDNVLLVIIVLLGRLQLLQMLAPLIAIVMLVLVHSWIAIVTLVIMTQMEIQMEEVVVL